MSQKCLNCNEIIIGRIDKKFCDDNEYRFCYEYGYLKIDAEKTLIVNWQPYMVS